MLLWLTRRQQAGKIVASVETVLLLLFSYSFGTGRLLRSLKHQYPLVVVESVREAGIKRVVVLGGGANAIRQKVD
jgi:hypothetical protein